MPPTGDAYNVDWCIASASNAHCANHRDWFVTYTPFKSLARGNVAGTLDIEGIGNVELGVKNPNRNAKPSYSVIQLEDVLYCPSAICNQVSIGCLMRSGYAFKLAQGGEISRNGVPIGIIDSPHLSKLRLSGQAPNQTSLDPEGNYLLSYTWPNEERARWERVKAGETQPAQSQPQVTPPYTDDEKRWLKDNWDGEFKFLTAHGLKIHDEEDRADGRRIVRAMMQDSDEDVDDESDNEDEFTISYTNGRGAKPLIPHPDGHMADYHFSEEQLIWIEENYGNSASFLYSHGLKFYKDEDCEEGKEILQAIMREHA